jgi:outer membrane protein OmpA-like peptidoglycan-associated protein
MGPFTIFYAADSSAIDVAASKTLRLAVAVYPDSGGEEVIVEGHSDKAGSAETNLRLSRLRARAQQPS